jgi:hypothetical protein
MGFEARIDWQDPRAAWVADVMVPVCLDVLRLTGDPHSSLYWKAASQYRDIAGRVNHRLVREFHHAVQTADRSENLPPVASAQRSARAMVLGAL